MSSILLVEDDETNRAMLARALARAGHEVMQVANGDAAISLGCRRRPAVIVADWMLQHRIHGLHVARALQLVDPAVRTVLMTGFPSQDLVEASRSAGACELLTKPFRLARLQETVAAAARGAAEGERTIQTGIGVLEVDARGAILYESPRATAILSRVRRDRRNFTLHELFHDRDVAALEEATEKWVETSPKRNQALRFAVRARTFARDDRRLLALCFASDHQSRSDPHLKMLLGIDTTCLPRWPFDERLLLVGGGKRARAEAAADLEHAGCTPYTADSDELALRLLAADAGIRFVVLDCTGSDADLRALIESFRRRRPDVVIVGSRAAGRGEDFSGLNVDLHLPREWRIADLIAMLRATRFDRPRPLEATAPAAGGLRFSPAPDSRTGPPRSSPRHART